MLGRVMLLCGARDGLLCGRQSIQLPSCASLFRISWDVCLGECTEWAEGTRIDRTLSVTACWRLLCVTTGDSYYPVHSGCLSACVSASVSASQAPTVWTATINQDHLGSHLSTQSHKKYSISVFNRWQKASNSLQKLKFSWGVSIYGRPNDMVSAHLFNTVRVQQFYKQNMEYENTGNETAHDVVWLFQGNFMEFSWNSGRVWHLCLLYEIMCLGVLVQCLVQCTTVPV